MSRRRAMVLAIASLVGAMLLHSGALHGAPEGLRITLALAVLVLLPGHALLAATGALPPGGPWLSSGWALGFGVAWLGLQILITRMLHVPFTLLAPWSAVPSALLWLLSAPREHAREPHRERLSRIALAFVLLAAFVAGLHSARLGTPVSYYTDSPDHIGTVRRMLAEGDAFPTDAFFRDAGQAGADPRKGLWHPCVALISRLADVDPLPTWRLLTALLAPLFVLNAAAFAFLIGGGAAAAVGAWALLLTYGGTLGQPYLREAVFATKLADQLAMATAAAVLLDLDARARQTRLAAVGLALGAVAAHVFASIQFAVVFGALGVGLLVRDRAWSPAVRRLTVTALSLALACLPYLLWRARLSYAPSNIIHTEPQGLLTLWDGATVVTYGELWDWHGAAWMLLPASVVFWARNAARPAVLYLLTTTLAVALIMFFPPSVALLQPRLGYLLMRFVWLLPLSGALAFAIPSLVRAWSGGGALRRAGAVLGLAGVAFLLRAPVVDAVDVLVHPAPAIAAEARVSIERWTDELRWMDRHLPQGSVVLSDPATSYSIPMMTRHWVSTLVDQHSSPNDSLALDRIMDARDALDPYASWARTRQVVRRWGITAIALNNRFAESPRLDYWAPTPAWFAAARARLDAQPAAFTRVRDTGDFVVYQVNQPVLDTLNAAIAPRTDVSVFVPADAAHAQAMGKGLPDLLGAVVSPDTVRAGDSVFVSLKWHASSKLPPGSYLVAVRFDRDMPPEFHAPYWLVKPARKVFEIVRHELYRFRRDHVPMHGEYGPDLWQADQAVSERVVVNVPPQAVSGTWRVQVRMLRQPHYPNYRLSDFFLDHDYYSGVDVATVTVVPGEAR